MLHLLAILANSELRCQQLWEWVNLCANKMNYQNCFVVLLKETYIFVGFFPPNFIPTYLTLSADVLTKADKLTVKCKLVFSYYNGTD